MNGADLTDRAVLAAIGERAGLDRKAIAADLASDKDEELVRKQAQAASASGIGGVPFFVFGGKIAVAGAQEPEVLSSAIDQALGSAPRITKQLLRGSRATPMFRVDAWRP